MSTRALSFRPAQVAAFTLVEMMSAMVVLIILGLIISQAFLATSKVMAGSNKDNDAYSEMRQALDRIGLDLAARIKRQDLPLYFSKDNGNDSFNFFSAVPTTLSSNPRGISRLFYRISPAYSLQRASEGVSWSNGGATPLTFVSTNSTLAAPAPSTVPADADFDTLAPGVFRLEVSYVSASSSPGNILNNFSNNNQATTPATWQTEVGSICIALASLDGDSRKLLNNPPTQLASLAAKLVDPADNQDTLSLWSPVVQNSSTLATGAGVPLLVAQRVRVIERFFPIN